MDAAPSLATSSVARFAPVPRQCFGRKLCISPRQCPFPAPAVPERLIHTRPATVCCSTPLPHDPLSNRPSVDHSCGTLSNLNPRPSSWQRIPSTVTWLFTVLYRGLLVGSIGLGCSAPALAKASPSTLLQTMEKNAQKYYAEIAKTSQPKNAHVKDASSDDNLLNGLTPEFWNSVGTPKGSVEEALREFLEENPTNVNALEVLLHSLLDKEDLSSALQLLEKLKQLEPEEMEWKYMQAEVYAANGQIEQAREGFEAILKLDPSSLRALEGLLIVMDELGDVEPVLKMVEDCVEKAKLDDKQDEARDLRMLLGQFHCLKGESHEAIKVYQDLIDEDPKDFRPYICQGLIYSALGDKDKAEEMFKMYKELCPRDFPDKENVENLIERAKKGGRLLDMDFGESEEEEGPHSTDESSKD